MDRGILKIAVSLKVIGQLCTERGFDAVRRIIDPDCLIKMINPADLYALEMALLIKEKIQERIGGVEVFAYSLSSAEDEGILRHHLAMGADQAFRIWDEGFDTLGGLARAYLLSKGIQQINPDLILCGKNIFDVNEYELGGYLAEFLHIPQIFGVISADICQKGMGLICRRKVERLGWELVETSLPVVLTVEPGESEPRYPNLFSIVNWLEKEIKVLNGASLGIDSSEMADLNSYVRVLDWSHPRPDKIFAPGSELPPEERMRLAMTAGVVKKKTEFLQGGAEEVTSKLVDILIKQKFFGTENR